ncbi:MAG: hypothetical protein PHG66_01035 [Candidatus Colwellbacteria bacterium]|nr:hypothetical protein [Candidatus Colwellbacteria bacterium]
MTTPNDILRMRRNKIVKTTLFDYTRMEYFFIHCRDGPVYIRKLINAPPFKKIDWSIEYTGKNREMYTTVGEYFVMMSVKKIFESFTRKEMNGWIKVLCILMERGFLSREIITRVESYISQKRMPHMLRCVVRILMNKALLFVKSLIKHSVSAEYYTGVDDLISSYVL